MFVHQRRTALAPDDLVSRRQAEVTYLARTLAIPERKAATLAFLGYAWEHGTFDPPPPSPTPPSGWLSR